MLPAIDRCCAPDSLAAISPRSRAISPQSRAISRSSVHGEVGRLSSRLLLLRTRTAPPHQISNYDSHPWAMIFFLSNYDCAPIMIILFLSNHDYSLPLQLRLSSRSLARLPSACKLTGRLKTFAMPSPVRFVPRGRRWQPTPELHRHGCGCGYGNSELNLNVT